jgi:phosphoglycolate phosphatase
MGAKVLLFDIDGTLIDCGGAGRTAMETAFGRLHGRADALAHFVFGGMTDPLIVREGLRKIGARETVEEVAALLDAYLEILEAELPKTSRFRVIPHVEATLERAKASGHRLGLGTGNLERGAAIKLRHAGIFEHFEFGGYSSDAEDRAELLGHGAARGRALAGESAEVVVIGDTPRDVAAARAIGATCIAVATGRFSVAELEATGAEHVVASLADARVFAVLGG